MYRKILEMGKIILIVLILSYGTAGAGDKSSKYKWATPIKINSLPNFHKVTNELYRGAQPEKGGMAELKKLGIKTIINLRSFHSERHDVEKTGLAYEHIFMKAWHPEKKEIIRFLSIVTDRNRTPVFVHCQHGADRTGLMCAIYRMVICGWSKQEAIKEMTQGGFGFHSMWKNIIKFIEKLDIESLRKEACVF